MSISKNNYGAYVVSDFITDGSGLTWLESLQVYGPKSYAVKAFRLHLKKLNAVRVK